MHTVQYLICKGPRWLFLSDDFLAVGGPEQSGLSGSDVQRD